MCVFHSIIIFHQSFGACTSLSNHSITVAVMLGTPGHRDDDGQLRTSLSFMVIVHCESNNMFCARPGISYLWECKPFLILKRAFPLGNLWEIVEGVPWPRLGQQRQLPRCNSRLFVQLLAKPHCRACCKHECFLKTFTCVPFFKNEVFIICASTLAWIT